MAQSDTVRDTVREGYARIAGGCCGSDTSCCGTSDATEADALAAAIGYTNEDLTDLPAGSNLGLSCGNPVALATLKPGEVVVDLGSGAGFDIFIAGRKVGPEGRAIGIDMTPEMLGKARRNAEQYRDQSGLDNIEFRLGEIEHLPLPDNSVDCVISNCVINLSPDKPQVWREVFRVLKPGGRVAISDMALLKDLPPDIRELAEALVGCVAGAVKVAETEAMAREAGFKHVACETHGEYVEAMKGHKGGLYDRIEAALPEGEQPSDYIVSLLVTGRKPKPGCCCEA